MPRKIGVYRRVSTDEQANAVEGSLDNQKYRLKSYVDLRNASEKNWGAVVEDYVDDGFSAKDTNRPAYQRMIADLKKKKIDLILVPDLSRLSRNLFDFCELLKFLDSQGASFLSIKEQFDTSTPVGRMIIYIIITLAQFEREQTSERVALGVHARGMRGLMNGVRPILGFDKDSSKPGVYVVNEEEAKRVRRIFDVYLDEGSKAKAIARLEELNIMPKFHNHSKMQQRKGKWSSSLLGSLLSTAAYTGYHEVNKNNKLKDQNLLKPSQRYQIVKASWPAIVSEEKFNDVQRLLKDAKEIERSRLKNAKAHFYILTGVFSCAECGLPLVGQCSHGGAGGTYRYYGHTTAGAAHGCSTQRVSADEIEGAVLKYLKESLQQAGYFKRLEKRFGEFSSKTTKGSAEELVRARAELQDVAQEASNIFRLQGQGTFGADTLKMMSERLDIIARKKEQVTKHIAAVERNLNECFDAAEASEYVRDKMVDFENGFRKAPPAVQKRLLRKTVKQLALLRDKLSIWFYTSDADDIPGRKLKLVRDENDGDGVYLVSGEKTALPKVAVASSDIGGYGDPGAI